MAPDHVEALHLLGLVHLQLGDPARAEPLIARSMKFGLSQPWNLANHAAALTGVGRHRDALALADRALVADPDHAPSHAARGDALLALGQYDAALTAYDRALVREPAHVTAWRKRGETLRWLERPADALISVERALRLDPSDAAANIERGHALRALGHRELALHNYQLAIVVRGKTPETVAACGVVLTELGRPADALACLDEGNRTTAERRATAVRELRRAGSAARPRRIAEALRPAARAESRQRRGVGRARQCAARNRASCGSCRGLRASAGAQSRRYRRAPQQRGCASCARPVRRCARRLRRGAGTDATHAELHYNRALALQQLGRYDDALASHAAAAAAPADTAQALFTRALARQHLGDDDAALADYANACRRDPNHGAARRSEAFCRLLMGDFDMGWRQHEARWEAADVMLHRRRTGRGGPVTNRLPGARCYCMRSRVMATRCSSAATRISRTMRAQR